MKNHVFENTLDWSGIVDQCMIVTELIDVNSDGKADLICKDNDTSVSVNIFINLL